MVTWKSKTNHVALFAGGIRQLILSHVFSPAFTCLVRVYCTAACYHVGCGWRGLVNSVSLKCSCIKLQFLIKCSMLCRFTMWVSPSLYTQPMSLYTQPCSALENVRRCFKLKKGFGSLHTYPPAMEFTTKDLFKIKYYLSRIIPRSFIYSITTFIMNLIKVVLAVVSQTWPKIKPKFLTILLE